MSKNIKEQSSVSPSGESPLFSYFNEIGIISQLSAAMFQRNLPEGLTNSQFSVLNWFVRVDSEATPGRLARAFQVTGGAMTNTLKKLEAKRLIKIEPDVNSGRSKRVTITTAGLAMREKCVATATPLFDAVAREFPQAYIEKQLKELRKVRKYLDENRFK